MLGYGYKCKTSNSGLGIMDSSESNICHLCNNSGSLTQMGILKVYLLSSKLPLILIFLGCVGAIMYSQYILIVSLFGLVYPLAMADLRLYLYPVTAIAHLLGKKLNCPKCEPTCSMFRK